MDTILNLDPDSYTRHLLHTQERDWAETNCYVDVWIEQLHALELDPIAAMAFTLTPDFEGDQWTFFKFQLTDLYELYGVEVQELVIWKPLIDHVEEQVKLGRPVLVELDSKYLPDTAGTAYQREHVKTTVSVNELDIANKHMGYFHAQGYYHLSGDDFTQVFGLPGSDSKAVLAPYVEIAKLNNLVKRSSDELRDISTQILLRQLKMMPKNNPFSAFRTRFESDFEWLKGQSIDMFHQYAFVTFRQFGACFELAANYLKWLDSDDPSVVKASTLYKEISEITKVYQFQLARAISRGKSLNLEVIDSLATKWQAASDCLKSRFLKD
ncbi:DUF1839 family protein [Pleionea sediminis]|uniref:DUF1839 family protein n=1 Tax=Pleionea sediminis TaxID=2569479 RepID=UPI001184ADA0|nr:DUF1839 family protein [Pleionea sediminis]